MNFAAQEFNLIAKLIILIEQSLNIPVFFCKEHCLVEIPFCDFTQYDIQSCGRRSIMENLRFEVGDCTAAAMMVLNGLVMAAMHQRFFKAPDFTELVGGGN